MPDKFNNEIRSYIMSRVGQFNTKPEKKVRSLLHHLGYRFRLHQKNLPGKPDIVLPKYRKVIFVHGCFWHLHRGCHRSSIPASNHEFWTNKLTRNKARDKRNIANIRALGWEVLIVWECEIKKLDVLEKKLTTFLKPDSQLF